ncbi:hypothetical protein KEJ51_05150 [Candidatus Bathyarchaeota archaeon]|nr:hypothetical protein [Candidatus Bathyarchaeota archaeon]
MSAFDSNIFVAFANKRDRAHSRSKDLMNRLKEGEFGKKEITRLHGNIKS